MSEENIWESLDLSEDKLKTAYDYLVPQAENLTTATKSMLKMDIEVSREISVGEVKREMIIYYLYVIAPFLGNFRKKILHVVEFPDTGRFPVNIWCYLDNTLIKNVAEKNLLSKVKEILSKTIVTNSIEGLYRQSLEAQKNSTK